jgi:hypothetical protein
MLPVNRSVLTPLRRVSLRCFGSTCPRVRTPLVPVHNGCRGVLVHVAEEDAEARILPGVEKLVPKRPGSPGVWNAKPRSPGGSHGSLVVLPSVQRAGAALALFHRGGLTEYEVGCSCHTARGHPQAVGEADSILPPCSAAVAAHEHDWDRPYGGLLRVLLTE